MPKLTVAVTGDYLAYELMRFTLKEIIRLHEADPYGFSGEDACELAGLGLSKVEELEADGP